MQHGKQHDIEPDSIEDYLCAIWFDEMPESGLAEWHRSQILNVSQCTGVRVSDIYTTDDTEPDYAELARRVNAAGWDTYDSDTRLIVFSPRPLEID
jgi:hypothetical protein